MSIFTSAAAAGDTSVIAIPSGTYVVDSAHTRIGFVARHAMITKVRGSFNEFVGEVIIDFELSGIVDDSDVGQRIGFEGTTLINRKDWGVSWNSSLDSGGLLVSDKVTLEFDVAAVREA